MKRLTATLLTTALLLGCTTVSRNSTEELVTEFADLEQKNGLTIRIQGIVSQTHGAAGVYLNARDLREENARCILPQPFEGLAHGELMALSGVLERTDCGKGKICTNACDQYVLHREPYGKL